MWNRSEILLALFVFRVTHCHHAWPTAPPARAFPPKPAPPPASKRAPVAIRTVFPDQHPIHVAQNRSEPTDWRPLPINDCNWTGLNLLDAAPTQRFFFVEKITHAHILADNAQITVELSTKLIVVACVMHVCVELVRNWGYKCMISDTTPPFQSWLAVARIFKATQNRAVGCLILNFPYSSKELLCVFLPET